MGETTVELLHPALFRALPGVVAGFSTRHGGMSEAPYDTLNLGLSTGDADAQVEANRRALADAVGFSADQFAVAGQVHGDVIKEVTEPGLFPGYDGMVTRTPGHLLAITAADCAALLLADPESHVVGACHSGWRGTVARISAKTVAAMQRLGAEPGRVCAYVSPCLSAEHFEVGPEVAEQFDAAFVAHPVEGGKSHVDMKAAIARQLEGAGVPDTQIAVSPRCTFAETGDFFSHRAENGTTGRMMGVIGMM